MFGNFFHKIISSYHDPSSIEIQIGQQKCSPSRNSNEMTTVDFGVIWYLFSCGNQIKRLPKLRNTWKKTKSKSKKKNDPNLLWIVNKRES